MFLSVKNRRPLGVTIKMATGLSRRHSLSRMKYFFFQGLIVRQINGQDSLWTRSSTACRMIYRRDVPLKSFLFEGRQTLQHSRLLPSYRCNLVSGATFGTRLNEFRELWTAIDGRIGFAIVGSMPVLYKSFEFLFSRILYSRWYSKI